MPIILPSYNNTMIIIGGAAIEAFRISANGEIRGKSDSAMNVTYSDGKLHISSGTWYTGSLILCSWKAK